MQNVAYTSKSYQNFSGISRAITDLHITMNGQKGEELKAGTPKLGEYTNSR